MEEKIYYRKNFGCGVYEEFEGEEALREKGLEEEENARINTLEMEREYREMQEEKRIEAFHHRMQENIQQLSSAGQLWLYVKDSI